MLLAAVLVDAFHAPLEDGEHALDRVRIDTFADVLASGLTVWRAPKDAPTTVKGRFSSVCIVASRRYCRSQCRRRRSWSHGRRGMADGTAPLDQGDHSALAGMAGLAPDRSRGDLSLVAEIGLVSLDHDAFAPMGARLPSRLRARDGAAGRGGVAFRRARPTTAPLPPAPPAPARPRA